MPVLYVSYVTDDTKESLIHDLPSYRYLEQEAWWQTKGVYLYEFVVYGRDKTFDMQSLKAFRSLKAYKYFLMALLGTFGFMNAQATMIPI